MKRWFIVVSAIVVVATAVVLAARQPGLAVQTAEVHRGRIRAYVEERAATRLPRTYLIAMPSAGRVLPIALQVGDMVDEGQVVARMAPEELQLAVDAAQARVDGIAAKIDEKNDNSLENLMLAAVREEVSAMDRVVEATKAQTEAAQARVELTEWDLHRYEKLRESEAASETELRDARFQNIDARVQYTTVQLLHRASQALQVATKIAPQLIQQYITNEEFDRAVLRHDMAAARAELGQAQLQQRRSEITSPVSGSVLARHVDSERVMSSGAPLLEIGRMEELEVEVEVLTQEAVNVAVGQEVDIFGGAIGDEPVAGHVGRIYPQGFTKVSSLGVEQQRVLVVVQFADGKLAALRAAGREIGSGYRVRVRIYTDTADDVVVVPRPALFRRPDGGWQVFAIQDGKAILTDIAIGLVNESAAQATSGLSAGNRVIVAPPASLENGDRVDAGKKDGFTMSSDRS